LKIFRLSKNRHNPQEMEASLRVMGGARVGLM